MVSRIPEGVAKDAPLLLVPDVLEGLRALGAAGRARSRAKVIGITGSVGKTSTKDMARDMLAEFGKVHAAEASFNNHWGVPITLARLPQDADFAVVEMGMSNAGEIAPLTALARPNVAIVTAIAPAHLESLGSLEAIAQEKASIFAGLEPGGTAIFPAELPTSSILERTARTHASTCLPMGKGDLPLHLHDIRQTETALVLRAKVGQMAVAVRLINSGAHAASNALACLGVAHALGLDLARAAFALGRWQPPAGRGLRQTILLDPIEEASFTLIDDAFNANPASMAAALALLAQTNPADGGRRVAIFWATCWNLARTNRPCMPRWPKTRPWQIFGWCIALARAWRHFTPRCPCASAVVGCQMPRRCSITFIPLSRPVTWCWSRAPRAAMFRALSTRCAALIPNPRRKRACNAFFG